LKEDLAESLPLSVSFFFLEVKPLRGNLRFEEDDHVSKRYENVKRQQAILTIVLFSLSIAYLVEKPLRGESVSFPPSLFFKLDPRVTTLQHLYHL
jgi:hypothetical protein